MRQLAINKTTFYAFNYVSIADATDTSGYKTGEKIITYSNAIEIKAHVSSARGSSNIENFGTDIQYDKVISMSRAYFEYKGLNENSVFVLDGLPTYSGSTPLYNYKITRIAKTLNEVVIAISQVRG